ncbi:hypothetical protein C8J57DRAFT_1318073 [Mycena rebaudengoi]|nr:hypothetical protein C8J57DRAFT_1318073 [Mycena rebaudengoi]
MDFEPSPRSFLMGALANIIIQTVLVSQTLIYFRALKRDSRWTRIFVAYVFCLELGNTALDVVMYAPLLLVYGLSFDALPPASVTQPLCAILVGVPIQLYFAWRVRFITGSNIPSAIIALFACGAVGGAVWTTLNIPTRNPSELAAMWLAASVLTDASIASSLAIASVKRIQDNTVRGSPGRSMDSVASGIKQTCTLMAILGTLNTLAFLLSHDEQIYFVWNLPLSKIYATGLMFVLNSRVSEPGDKKNTF